MAELDWRKWQDHCHLRTQYRSNPWTRGHALVIPRNHSHNLYEAGDGDLAASLTAAKRLAERMRERLACDGVNVLNCCEPAAWQTVFHLHLHVIPRYDDDPLELPVRPRAADRDELAAVAADLRGLCLRRRPIAERIENRENGERETGRDRKPRAQARPARQTRRGRGRIRRGVRRCLCLRQRRTQRQRHCRDRRRCCWADCSIRGRQISPSVRSGRGAARWAA